MWVESMGKFRRFLISIFPQTREQQRLPGGSRHTPGSERHYASARRRHLAATTELDSHVYMAGQTTEG